MSAPQQKWYTVSHPEPGDIAMPIFDDALDDREVARVEGDRVWLNLIGAEAGPYPASNYTYERRM